MTWKKKTRKNRGEISKKESTDGKQGGEKERRKEIRRK